MSGPLTPEERQELAALEERERLEHLRATDRRRHVNEALRAAARPIIEQRNAKVNAPRELEPWKIRRAYRRDVEGAPGGCATHPHRPGSVESVAHRLGVSERGLYDRRAELGMADWPPE